MGDVDHDGDLDAAIANLNQPNRIWLNNGQGNFVLSENNVGNAASLSVRLGDLDGDGDLDAFFANFNQPDRIWLNGPLGAAAMVSSLPDSDRVIGFSDFLVLAANFGEITEQGLVAGDWDFNGKVDFADALILVRNFGKPVWSKNSANP